MKARIVKWGNSLAVRIPKPVAEAALLREGDLLEIETLADHIKLHRVSRIPSFAKLIAEITPENRYEEILSGAETGKEKIEW